MNRGLNTTNGGRITTNWDGNTVNGSEGYILTENIHMWIKGEMLVTDEEIFWTDLDILWTDIEILWIEEKIYDTIRYDTIRFNTILFGNILFD